MNPVRLIITALVLGFGYWKGGWYGVMAMFFIFGIFLLIWQVTTDALQRIERKISEPKVTTHVYQGETLKGHPDVQGTARRHPDPTRPTTDDYMGLITYKVKQGK